MKRESLLGLALVVSLAACESGNTAPTSSLVQKLSGTWTGTTTTDYGSQQTSISFNNYRYPDGSYEIVGGMKLEGGKTATAQTEVVEVQVNVQDGEAVLNACIDTCVDNIDSDDVLYTYSGTLLGDTLSGTVLVAVGGVTVGSEGVFSLTQDSNTASAN